MREQTMNRKKKIHKAVGSLTIGGKICRIERACECQMANVFSGGEIWQLTEGKRGATGNESPQESIIDEGKAALDEGLADKVEGRQDRWRGSVRGVGVKLLKVIDQGREGSSASLCHRAAGRARSEAVRRAKKKQRKRSYGSKENDSGRISLCEITTQKRGRKKKMYK